LVQAKGIQHGGGTGKRNSLALLANGQGGQENGHQAILAPRQAVGRMTSHLEQELTVTPFVKEHSWRGPLDGQAAQHKGSRRKSQILSDRYAFQANAFDSFSASQLLLGGDQIGSLSLQDCFRRLPIISVGSVHESPREIAVGSANILCEEASGRS
jgi:hypothetical protein